VRLVGPEGKVRAVELEYTRLDAAGRLTGTGDGFMLEADMVFKAIGQIFVGTPLLDGAVEPLDLHTGRILVNDDQRTSLPGVWAGGDCVQAGQDLTVECVQHGKLAAHSIDRFLRGN
jgi:glutamate synthase (NADPH/NADH) small chain